MKIKKRTAFIMSVVVIVSFLIGSIVVAAAPEDTGLDALWDAIFGLEEDVEELQEQSDLETRLSYLEGQFDMLPDTWLQGPPGPQGEQGETGPQGPPGGIGTPDFDSGWTSWGESRDVQVDHNLGTNDLIVYLMGRTDYGLVFNAKIGGDVYYSPIPDEHISTGAWWEADPNGNTIHVWKGYTDTVWDDFRLLIWLIT